MHVYVTQANFTTKPRFEIKNKRSFTEMNSQGSRVEKNTHKKCKCKNFCSQTRLVGEIYSSDVIMHRGYLSEANGMKVQITDKRFSLKKKVPKTTYYWLTSCENGQILKILICNALSSTQYSLPMSSTSFAVATL